MGEGKVVVGLAEEKYVEAEGEGERSFKLGEESHRWTVAEVGDKKADDTQQVDAKTMR